MVVYLARERGVCFVAVKASYAESAFSLMYRTYSRILTRATIVRSTIASTDAQLAMKRKKEELKKQTELENVSDDYIEALIYHSMWDSEACMKNPNDVTSGLKKLKYKKDKLQALKDNIQIRYRGFGWDEWKTH